MNKGGIGPSSRKKNVHYIHHKRVTYIAYKQDRFSFRHGLSTYAWAN
jgi:hypothetical protein